MSSDLSRREFQQEIDRWIADVRTRALEFFDGGTPAASALRSAIAMATAITLQRHRDRIRRAGDEPLARAKNH